MDKKMKLSIVTTLYKSSQYIDEFYTRISIETQKITDDYEIIFVDDGSPDDSLQKIVINLMILSNLILLRFFPNQILVMLVLENEK